MESINFTVELINFTSEDILPSLQEYFATLSTGIHLDQNDDTNFSWKFDSLHDFSIFFGMVHTFYNEGEHLEKLRIYNAEKKLD